MKRYAYSVLYFIGYALLGPAIASFHAWTELPMSYFVYEVVGQIWPFWALSQYETTIGTFYAVSFATGWNVVVFAVLGLVAGMASRNRLALASLFAVTCAAHLWWFLFAMGSFPRRLVTLVALVVGLVLITVPFLLVACMRHERGT
jgi:hypothetical protein